MFNVIIELDINNDKQVDHLHSLSMSKQLYFTSVPYKTYIYTLHIPRLITLQL